MKDVRDYKQCGRCVMDTTDPDITFDTAGNCNHCSDLLQKQRNHHPIGIDALIAKIKEEGKGRKYDCVLGISGGVDSCYAAYKLKQYGIRTLLVHMDNGWNAKQAVSNIKNISNILEFDYESYVLDWIEFRQLQVSFLKASVIEAETPTDIAILGALHRVAARYRVCYIISGGNTATEGILPAHWHYNSKDRRFLESVNRQFGGHRLKKFPFFGVKEEVYYKFVQGIQIAYLLNYLPFSKDEAIRELTENLKWQNYGGKHYESRYTRFVQSYLLPLKFNLDYRKATFSSQIVAGKMTREEAIEQLKLPIYNKDEIQNELLFVTEKLGISMAELEAIMAAPPKTYRDYPNNAIMLPKLYKLYRSVFKTQ